MDAVKQVVAANKDYIPPEGKVGVALFLALRSPVRWSRALTLCVFRARCIFARC